MYSTLALGMPGGTDWLVIGIIALLLFGRRLPETMRNMGKGIMEFKKGMKGIEDDLNAPAPDGSSSADGQPKFRFDPYTGQPIVPAPPPGAKFDPYTGKPLDQSS